MQDTIYGALEQQWFPLLSKFANTKIRGFEYDDLLQEMRVCLWKAEATFDRSKKVTFITYLWKTCQNHINNLIAYTSRQKRNYNVVSIDEASVYGKCDDLLNTVEWVNCLNEPDKTIAQALLLGYTKKEIIKYTGLSATDLEAGLDNIKSTIGGYYYG